MYPRRRSNEYRIHFMHFLNLHYRLLCLVCFRYFFVFATLGKLRLLTLAFTIVLAYVNMITKTIFETATTRTYVNVT